MKHCPRPSIPPPPPPGGFEPLPEPTVPSSYVDKGIGFSKPPPPSSPRIIGTYKPPKSPSDAISNEVALSPFAIDLTFFIIFNSLFCFFIGMMVLSVIPHPHVLLGAFILETFAGIAFIIRKDHPLQNRRLKRQARIEELERELGFLDDET